MPISEPRAGSRTQQLQDRSKLKGSTLRLRLVLMTYLEMRGSPEVIVQVAASAENRAVDAGPIYRDNDWWRYRLDESHMLPPEYSQLQKNPVKY